MRRSSGKRRRVERGVERAVVPRVEAPLAPALPAPEVCAEDGLAVFSAALGNALEKLLGHKPTAEDRIFHFDPERQRASLELPSLRPPQQLSCAVEMEEDVEFSDLTKSEQVTLQQSVEHKISKLMLKELESEGLLTFDSSQPPLHAWVPGKDQRRIALIPRVQRRVKTVPPRVTRASATGVKTGEPVFMRLRKLQDSFAANPPDEYKEQIIFRQSVEEPWYATVTFCGFATNGERMEGAALGPSAQVAREAAIQVLLDKLPRSLFATTAESSTRTATAYPKMSRVAPPGRRTWTRPFVPGPMWRQGSDLRLKEAPQSVGEPRHEAAGARTPPPPPKPKRMQPRMVS